MTCVKPPCGVLTSGSCDPTCECVPDLCNLPNPYVVNATANQECHCSTIIQQLYVTGLSLKAAIIVPAISGEVVAAIAGVHSVIVGSYFWNPTYGYFKITGFDYATEQVTLLNEGQSGNAVPGSTIPACTLFLVVDEPCCEPGVGGVLYYPYLAVDFTAPANGACLDITVTSITGLATGMEVQIGTGVYQISSIVSSTIINICNTGSGATAGTVVEALDVYGVYATPVLPVGVALCGGTDDTTGSLVICAGGLPTVLSGTSLGYVPALTNAITNEVEFTDPATLFSIDPCLWDLSARVLNGIVNYYADDAGGIIAPSASRILNRMATSPVLIENNTCATCYVLLAFTGYSGGVFDAGNGDYANISTIMHVGSDVSAIGTTSVVAGAAVATNTKEIGFNRTYAAINYTPRVEWLMNYTIPAGDELQVGFSVEVTNNASNVNSFNTGTIYGEIKGYLLSI
jgi:hypothetical protein